MKATALVLSVSMIALMAGIPANANAETVTTTTRVEAQDLPNATKIHFEDFDLNGDGAFSMTEVGEKLFNVFDTNHDKLIDNTEWDKRNLYTITPMQMETFRYIDHNDDGLAEESTYTYQSFYEASGLIKFDKDQDGLSAKEFIGAGFENLDGDDNKLISLKEWKRAYMSSRPKHDRPENYNQ